VQQKNWHSLDPVETVKILDSDSINGLTPQKVETRLVQYGPNELTKEKKTSPVIIFLSQFKNILIIILLAAITLSIVIGEVVDGIIISVIVLFAAILGFIQEYRAERALEALKKMLSPTITVLRDNSEEEIPAKMLVPGDILLLEAGDKIPADARLLEAFGFKCDESSLTGESFSIDKVTKSLDKDLRIGDKKNMVFAGTVVTYGRAKAIVTETGMNTEFGKIAEQVTNVKAEKTPLEKRTTEIGKWLGIIAVSICALVAVFSIARQGLSISLDPFRVEFTGQLDLKFVLEIIMFGVALAVAAVPEALAAIVTGALSIGMHQMAKQNALIRKMPAVETLGCTTVICTDKTGTLTKGEMTVRKLYLNNTLSEVTGAGYAPVGEIKNVNPDTQAFKQFLLASVLCNDSGLFRQDDAWIVKGDPTEASLCVLAQKAGEDFSSIRARFPRVSEMPFSSERKCMTTVNEGADGKRFAFMKGAGEIVLSKCSRIMIDDSIVPLDDRKIAELLNLINALGAEALRVLGFAFKEAAGESIDNPEALETGLIFIGLVGMIDPPRAEAIEAIKTCREISIRTIMITGDHQITATAIAKEVGIYSDGDLVLTGAELETMSEEDLEKIVDKVSVYARVSPIDKLKIVTAWKKRGEVVAMTGDGVNDAPALKHADIGIAMGITGTEVTKDAADMVLQDDNFATIVKAIERGRWIYDNIKKYLTYLMRCNITEVAVIGGVVLILGTEFLPLLPAAILYINLATDGLPALALGVAPPDPDIMKRPPRDPKESVFSWDVKAFIVLALIIEIPFFYFLFLSRAQLAGLTHEAALLNARTEIFFLFIIIELIIALNFRSMKYSIFTAPPHKWLWIAILWEIALLFGLIQIPALRDAFGIAIPNFLDIEIILGFGAVIFFTMEMLKLVIRKRENALSKKHKI
jgi:Ca2+-transporting ATPase